MSAPSRRACDHVTRRQNGEATPGRTAGESTDNRTVSRYLTTLVDLGLLRRSELNREGGGVVNVYHSVDLERMRRETLVGFYVWAGEAASLIEDANPTKRDYREADTDQSLPDVSWDGNPE